MNSDDISNDQKATDNAHKLITENEETNCKKEITTENGRKTDANTVIIKTKDKEDNNIKKNTGEQSCEKKEEEKYVESEFTKKYGYLVPSNDSIYGIHSYCQDYSGYTGYFDYSASQYVTTPYNLYTATFAAAENIDDTTSINDNSTSNDSNTYNEDSSNQSIDDQNLNKEKIDEKDISQEQENIDKESALFLNISSSDVKEEVVYPATENNSENETRKRQHSKETSDYEPVQKKTDNDGIEDSNITFSCNDSVISSDTSLSNDIIGLNQNKEKKKTNKKIKSVCKNQEDKKNISSELMNKEKPLNMGSKLSQEMDISSILGTDISMGISTIKPKVVEEIAKESEEKKVTLNLRSAKKTLFKPKIKLIVAKEAKNNTDTQFEIQFCDEKKTLIKIAGSKIGIYDRKKIYLQIFNALKQQGVSEEEAKNLATQKEHNCAIESSDNSKYKSKCYNEIMKIKKRDCSPFVDKSIKKLEFSIEDVSKFHEYLQEFILTEQQYKINDYPTWDPKYPGEIAYYDTKTLSQKSYYAASGENQRFCCRCSKTFEINSTTYEPTKKDVVCIYHSEKLMINFARRSMNDKTFNCCGGSNDTVGCKEGDEHVTMTQPYCNLKNFKECPPSKENDKFKSVYALDCEMILTVAGQDVARVTVVDMNCQVIYDQLIKPKYRVTDYRTQYSGITEELLNTNSLTLEKVQEKLFEFIDKDTILIGHSLNCDLEALKLIHKNVVDTSITFPHRNPQFKNPLKKLAKLYINMDIQEAHTGHDSAEDAIAAMRLLIAKYQGKI